MDQITATIVGGILWFFLGSAGTVIVYFVVTLVLGTGLAALTRHEGFIVVGIFLGWLAAIAWEVIVFIQVVLHVVRLIQLATGSAVTV